MINWLTIELSGTVLIVAVLVFRGAFSRIATRNLIRKIWIIPIAALLIPFRIHSHQSVGSLMANAMPIRPQYVSTVEMKNSAVISFLSTMNDGPGSISWWLVLWCAGCLSCLLYFAVTFLRCCNEFDTSLPISDPVTSQRINAWKKTHPVSRKLEVRQLDTIRSPLTYRVFHPVILLPTRMIGNNNREDFEYVLEHEYQHVVKNDELYKMLLVLAVCFHWFNPYAWVMLYIANEDVEMACDERVMDHFGYHHKKAYANMLINVEANTSRSSFYNNFSTNDLGERLEAIASSVKKSVLREIILLSVLFGFTVILSFSVNGKVADRELWTESEGWITDMTLSRKVFEYHNGQWIQYGGITVVFPRDDDGEEWIELAERDNGETQGSPEWVEQLPPPSENMRVLYDNWGEPEFLLELNEQGEYEYSKRFWVQVR